MDYGRKVQKERKKLASYGERLSTYQVRMPLSEKIGVHHFVKSIVDSGDHFKVTL